MKRVICLNYHISDNYFCPKSTDYQGQLSETISGRVCQPWSAQVPHKHKDYSNDADFPLGNISSAKNYCRDPSGLGRTWCYTMDPNIRWEFCNYPTCLGMCLHGEYLVLVF